MHFLSLLRNKQDKQQTIILLWNMASFIFLLKTTQQDEHKKIGSPKLDTPSSKYDFPKFAHISAKRIKENLN